MSNFRPSAYRLGYRGDIEGLRALAILLVVAAHANVPGLAGGFVGVDVFFVLSGYLISGLLIQEIDASGDFRFAAFYARRLRRLVPALLFMLLVTCVLAWLLLIPLDQLGQAKAASGAALWLSNFYFAFSNLNYFSPDAKSNLFLHTWSLGVEEQFYIVWPLLIMLVAGAWQGAKRKPRTTRLKIAMPVVFVLSLGLCLWWTSHAPHLAFYMMPSRAWQFALGALVFAYFGSPREPESASANPTSPGRIVLSLAGWLGIAMILLAAAILNDHTAYPGAWALLPSIGAALAIAAGSTATRFGVDRLLSLRFLQNLGRISYSWYLWHWPVLLLGATVVSMSSGWHRLGLVLLSLLFAVVSYRFVEAPIRRMKLLLVRPRVTVVAGVSLAAIAGLLTVQWYSASMKEMKSPEQARYLLAEWDAPVIYNMGCDDWYSSARVTVCEFGSTQAHHTAVLLGDSVGAQWFPAIRAVYDKPGWRLLVMTKSACPIVDEPIFYQRIDHIYVTCSTWRRNALARIASLKPDVVILGSTYTYDYTKSQWISGTRDILNTLSPVADHIYILRSTPMLAFDGPTCLAPRSFLFRLLAGHRTCSQSADNRLSDEVFSWLNAAARRFPNTSVVDMTDAVCPNGKCQAQRDGMIVYRDDRHLTATFIKSLAPSLAAALHVSLSDKVSAARSGGG